MMERVQPHIYSQSSFRCLISQPHDWVLHKLLFTASHPGFRQQAPDKISKGNRVRNCIHFFLPTATFIKLQPVKPVLLSTHLLWGLGLVPSVPMPFPGFGISPLPIFFSKLSSSSSSPYILEHWNPVSLNTWILEDRDSSRIFYKDLVSEGENYIRSHELDKILKYVNYIILSKGRF